MGMMDAVILEAQSVSQTTSSHIPNQRSLTPPSPPTGSLALSYTNKSKNTGIKIRTPAGMA